jgi:multiple sugar transport system permease protein
LITKTIGLSLPNRASWLTWKQRRIIAAYLFIGPAIVLLTIFLLLPLISVVSLSFTNYNLATISWAGLDNYIHAFHDEVFLKSIQNTVFYAATNIPGQMILGLILALILNEKIRARGLYRTMYYFPVVTSMVVVAMVWLWIYEPSWGLLNQVLDKLHLPLQNWLSDTHMAMPAIVIMSVWKGTGNAMILFLAGLQGIPEELYESSKIDGANRWDRFLHITLPLLKPTTFFIFVMYCIWAFQVFDQVYIMTKGGPVWSTTTIVHQIYQNAFLYVDMGYASTFATILFVIVLAITIINLNVFKGSGTYE